MFLWPRLTCGGKDRFRSDNQDGRCTWLCNQSGVGDGLNLVEKALSLSARAAAEQVAAVMGKNANALSPAAETRNASQKVGGQDKADAQRKAALQAQGLGAAAQCKRDNAYLSARGWPEVDMLALQGQPLRVGGITFQPGDLLLPLNNTGGEVVNVQLINASGDKRILAGGQVKAACHTLCGPKNAVIWLTEGYVTGLTGWFAWRSWLSSCAATTRMHGCCWRLIVTVTAPCRPVSPRRPHSPAVILAVNNTPMQFSDRSGGISRHRVILTYPEAIATRRA